MFKILFSLLFIIWFYCLFHQVFTREQEDALKKYALRCQEHYYGLSVTELKVLAFEMAVRLKIQYPDSWNENQMTGWKWYYNFMACNPELVLRTPEQTSLNRVRAFCKENVEVFFRNLDAVLTPSFLENPYTIYNMDETGISTVPSKIGKIISLRGLKKVGQITIQERGTMMTMALAVSAGGNHIPPMFVFPRKNLPGHYMDGAPSRSLGVGNESGWMCQPDFVKFMLHFVEHAHASVFNPTILLLDNHSSCGLMYKRYG